MDSEGGGNASDGRDNDQTSLLESGENHHHQHRRTFEQSSSDNHSQNHHDSSSKRIIKMTVYFFAVVLACFVLFHSPYSIQYFYPISYDPFSRPSQDTIKSNQSSLASVTGNFSDPMDDLLQGNSSPTANNLSLDYTAEENLPLLVNDENEETKLEKLLNEAAMVSKTIIITTLNGAWTAPNSIFDLFLESFEIGIETKKFLNHLVVIALDQKAYSRCLELHHLCYALATEGVDFSGEAIYMSEIYLKMMWERLEFMMNVLKMGYDFIATDADIMWFRDPFLHFHINTDFQIACDHYAGTTDPNSAANGGFYYVKSNNQTIQFYEFWFLSKDKFPGRHEQDVFNMIRFDPYVEKIGFKIKYLDTTFYGGFCEPSQDLNLACTMHATCCIGLGDKLHDLNMLVEDWKKYMALTNDEKITIPQTWTLPRICGPT